MYQAKVKSEHEIASCGDHGTHPCEKSIQKTLFRRFLQVKTLVSRSGMMNCGLKGKIPRLGSDA